MPTQKPSKRRPTRPAPATPALFEPRLQEPAQERASSWTHGVAAVLSVLGLGPLVGLATLRGDVRHVVSFAIFGAALVLLFTASAFMHHYRGRGKARAGFEFLDHAGIYTVIAATYTPFCLVTLQGPWGWSLFGVIWGLAAVGISLALGLGERFNRFADGIYLVMGWLILIAIRPLAARLPWPGVALVIGGGLAYTVGVVILGTKRFYYYHAAWHLMVALGAGLHLAAMLIYVLPAGR